MYKPRKGLIRYMLTFCRAQNILKDNSPNYLAINASWPDDFDHHEGTWSEVYHFIDAKDCPPNVKCDEGKPLGCYVTYPDDCKSEGCVIRAIANYTQRVKDQDLDHEQIREALLFLVHFLGDITQPLHNEDVAKGGNEIHLKFKRANANLHSSWDTFIPEEMNGVHHPPNVLPVALTWAHTLIDAIDNGIYHPVSAGWIKDDDVSNVEKSALRWSTEANALVCKVVMPKGPWVLRNTDLFPDYYNSAKDTVSLQIARAGYRLANWLNMLAPSSCKQGGLIYAKAPSSQKPVSFDEEEL